ncbi:hypothetical protein CVT26_016093 [Gymnopilus dilepis]|uniref:Uncharacterized protein n=1 Tax=Gymnopilus dilepis TaxID=231916 RepID=A0A409X3V1_9AGAR|nr:hypothetical protein CVT26_016093 [Gymnopilus dilepis]
MSSAFRWSPPAAVTRISSTSLAGKSDPSAAPSFVLLNPSFNGRSSRYQLSPFMAILSPYPSLRSSAFRVCPPTSILLPIPSRSGTLRRPPAFLNPVPKYLLVRASWRQGERVDLPALKKCCAAPLATSHMKPIHEEGWDSLTNFIPYFKTIKDEPQKVKEFIARTFDILVMRFNPRLRGREDVSSAYAVAAKKRWIKRRLDGDAPENDSPLKGDWKKFLFFQEAKIGIYGKDPDITASNSGSPRPRPRPRPKARKDVMSDYFSSP